MQNWCAHLGDGGNLSGGVDLGWNFCPICGKPRPVEKKVECPPKFETANGAHGRKLNAIIDYLASKPWEKQ